MLRYSLICDKGHEFEGWFRDSSGFDEQAKRGFLSCTICGSSHVTKAIMAPSVARRDRERPTISPVAGNDAIAHIPQTGSNAASPAPAPVALLSESEKTLRDALKALRQHVEATAENVGTDFAATARQMHDGDIEHKSIFGVATPDEINALHEDGIAAHPLPILPEERN